MSKEDAAQIYSNLPDNASFLELLNASWGIPDIENNVTGKGDTEIERDRYISPETVRKRFSTILQIEGEDLETIYDNFDSLIEMYDHGRDLSKQLKHGIVRTLASTSAQAFRKMENDSDKIEWAERAYYWFGQYRDIRSHEGPREKLYMALELAQTREFHADVINNQEQKKQHLLDGFRDLRAVQGDIPVDDASQFKFHLQLRFLAHKLCLSVDDAANKKQWLHWRQEEADAVIGLRDPSKETLNPRYDYIESMRASIDLAKVTNNRDEKKSYLLLANKRYTEIIALVQSPAVSEYIEDAENSIYILTQLVEVTDEPKEKNSLIQRLFKEQIAYGSFMQAHALKQEDESNKKKSLDTSATTFYKAAKNLDEIPQELLKEKKFSYEYELLMEAGETAQRNNHVAQAVNIFKSASVLAENFANGDISEENRRGWVEACYEFQIKSAEFAEELNKLDFAAAMFVNASKTAQSIAKYPDRNYTHSISWYTKALNITNKVASLWKKVGNSEKFIISLNVWRGIRTKIETLKRQQRNEQNG